MSETYIVRLFVADPVVAAPRRPERGPDGHLHGVVVQVATGRERTFRDEASFIAAFHDLAERDARRAEDWPADDAASPRVSAFESV